MPETNAVGAVYENHSTAEEAVKKLQKSVFDTEKLSIVGEVCIFFSLPTVPRTKWPVPKKSYKLHSGLNSQYMRGSGRNELPRGK